MTVYLVSMYLASLALGYVLAFTGATLNIGRSLNDAVTPTGYQDAITPPKFSTFAIVVYISCGGGLIYGFWKFGLLAGLGTTIAFVSMVALNKVIVLPRSQSEHYRKIIVHSMINRHANYLKASDIVRAKAVGMLLERLGIPVADLTTRLNNPDYSLSTNPSEHTEPPPVSSAIPVKDKSIKTLGIDSPERAIPCMCITQAGLYLDIRLSQVFGRPMPYNRRGSSQFGDRHYDVYTFMNPTTSREEECFFDITAFFGRGDIYSTKLDLPAPGVTIPVEQIIGKEAVFQAVGLSDDIEPEKAFEKALKLNQIPVTFKQFSSEMISRYIALLYPEDRTIDATPLRCHDENHVPILHGFQFYQLFIIHALCHIDSGFNQRRTETTPRPDYYIPVIGKDCMHFKPLQGFHFANDFINYTFWTHRPRAFQEKNEINAFYSAALYALGKRLMTKDEMITAIQSARPDEDTLNILSGAVRKIPY
jgi:hypothetical protein